jgi:hypothetical protein
MFIVLAFLLGAGDSQLEAKFELMKVKKNYDKLYVKCTTQDQKIVVFVNYENLEVFNKLLKEYPKNTLFCYAEKWQDFDKGIVVGRYNKNNLERYQDIKPDELDQLFPKVLPKALPKAKDIKYPLREHFWSGCPDWRHLTSGIHAGKFDSGWLKTLSWEELQSLHSDDHEGHVQWKYVVRCPQ